VPTIAPFPAYTVPRLDLIYRYARAYGVISGREEHAIRSERSKGRALFRGRSNLGEFDSHDAANAENQTDHRRCSRSRIALMIRDEKWSEKRKVHPRGYRWSLWYGIVIVIPENLFNVPLFLASSLVSKYVKGRKSSYIVSNVENAVRARYSERCNSTLSYFCNRWVTAAGVYHSRSHRDRDWNRLQSPYVMLVVDRHYSAKVSTEW